jgi:hypothetical protein
LNRENLLDGKGNIPRERRENMVHRSPRKIALILAIIALALILLGFILYLIGGSYLLYVVVSVLVVALVIPLFYLIGYINPLRSASFFGTAPYQERNTAYRPDKFKFFALVIASVLFIVGVYLSLTSARPSNPYYTGLFLTCFGGAGFAWILSSWLYHRYDRSILLISGIILAGLLLLLGFFFFFVSYIY